MVTGIKQPIDPCEGPRAGTDDDAGGNRAPEGIRAGEIPDRQNSRNHGDYDARGRDPKRQCHDDGVIEIASSFWGAGFDAHRRSILPEPATRCRAESPSSASPLSPPDPR